MLVELFSAVALRNKSEVIRIAVHASTIGLPSITILGCASSASRETILKLRAMFRHCGWKLPAQKYTISITPSIAGSELKGIESALAVGLLAAADRIAPPPHPFGIFGSVDLNGAIRQDGHAHEHISALLSIPQISIAFNTARACAQWSPLTSVRSLPSISTLKHCELARLPPALPYPLLPPPLKLPELVLCQAELRAIQVIAAGKHTSLFYGSPGEGKTRSAELTALITDSYSEQEVMQPHSKCKNTGDHQPPFFGSLLRPTYTFLGPECTPTQLRDITERFGILILNELPLFPSSAQRTLREILDGTDAPQIIASMNPCCCPATERKDCVCSATTLRRYNEKPDTPLLDRFDIFQTFYPSAVVKAVQPQQSFLERLKEMRTYITTAGQRQYARHIQGAPRWNGNYTFGDLHLYAKISPMTWNMLEQTRIILGLSRRRITGIGRVARTIADMENSEQVGVHHVQEGILLRPPKRLQ